MRPQELGSNLIQCILYCFSLRFDIHELSMVLNEVGIFESIKTLLTETALSKSLNFKTSTWSLMEMLTTTVLALKQEHFVQTKRGGLSLFDRFLENVYNLQIEQLHDIAQIEQRTLSRFVPELPRRSHPIFKS